MKQEKIKELLADMSLEEKIGQLMQLSNNFYEDVAVLTGPAMELGIGEKEIQEAGSTLSIFGAEKIRKIQEEHCKKQPHQIPLLFMADVINGYKTIFPIPLAQGCTFDPMMAKECAGISAKEAAVNGLHVTFSPMVDLVRDARWGRVMESTGEDKYLNSQFAKEIVEGYQGEHLSDWGSIAACVKHFAGYGAPTAGKEYNNVELSMRTLREDYLPAYQAAIDANSAMVMTSFNTLDRIPATGNKWLMQDVLRQEMGFEGVLISDWAAIEELIAQGIAQDKEEAAKLAIDAGVDIDMATNVYIKNLVGLVERGIVSQKQIDEAVLRILNLKNDLGLFENPYKDLNEATANKLNLCEEHRQTARKAAAQSMVLLKNEQILPLKKEGMRLALIGPYAEEKRLYGAWSLLGDEEDTISIKDGLLAKEYQNEIEVVKGTNILGTGEMLYGFKGLVTESNKIVPEDSLIKAIETAKNADIVILALGEHAYHSGEGGSRSDIKIPEEQMELFREVCKVNQNVVTILFSGRPLDLREIVAGSRAVLQAWFPGSEGGNAIADLLYADKMPEGRLSITFPYCVGQVPIHYDHFNTGRPFDGNWQNRFQSKYMDIPNEPLFAFGYGLTYTQFAYSDLKLSSHGMWKGETIQASVTLTNTGENVGTETVQCYLCDQKASVVRPVKELKGFKKVTLAPLEVAVITFEITQEMLRFYDIHMNYVSEPGKFSVFIGSDSTTQQYVEFRLMD